MVTDPVYLVYVDSNIMAGRKILYADGTEENNFCAMPDPDVKADIIYLCSPNNPTGACLNKEHGLKAATVQYAKTRPVFEQYKATKYSRKFLAEHEADLELYRAAQAEMRSLLGGAKLPKMDVLKEEGRKLTAKKKQLYGEYQKARRDMQEIVTIKANIDTLMGYTEPGRKQEKER